MNAVKAANDLHAQLRTESWVTAVGVGREMDTEIIIVYVKSVPEGKASLIPEEWEGFPVGVKKIGSLKPLRFPFVA